MTKSQLIAISSFTALLLVLLFGFKTKPVKLIQEEKSRLLNLQFTDISILDREAKENLSPDERSKIQVLESRLELTSDSTERINIYKELSSAWYSLAQFSMAGHFAEQIAEYENTAESWGIAGTTFALGASKSQREKEKLFCRDKAIENLEIAISEDPDNLEYQINRAVVLAEHPIEENPMKGIQLLLGLNKNYPKNVSVINNLARFALQTNQLDKAEARLFSALELEPDNKLSSCLLVQLYEKTGDVQKRDFYRNKCDK